MRLHRPRAREHASQMISDATAGSSEEAMLALLAADEAAFSSSPIRSDLRLRVPRVLALVGVCASSVCVVAPADVSVLDGSESGVREGCESEPSSADTPVRDTLRRRCEEVIVTSTGGDGTGGGIGPGDGGEMEMRVLLARESRGAVIFTAVANTTGGEVAGDDGAKKDRMDGVFLFAGVAFPLDVRD